MSDYFKNINEINYEGPESENPLSLLFTLTAEPRRLTSAVK